MHKLIGVDMLPKMESSECAVEWIHGLIRPQALPVVLDERGTNLEPLSTVNIILNFELNNDVRRAGL